MNQPLFSKHTFQYFPKSLMGKLQGTETLNVKGSRKPTETYQLMLWNLIKRINIIENRNCNSNLQMKKEANKKKTWHHRHPRKKGNFYI